MKYSSAVASDPIMAVTGFSAISASEAGAQAFTGPSPAGPISSGSGSDVEQPWAPSSPAQAPAYRPSPARPSLIDSPLLTRNVGALLFMEGSIKEAFERGEGNEMRSSLSDDDDDDGISKRVPNIAQYPPTGRVCGPSAKLDRGGSFFAFLDRPGSRGTLTRRAVCPTPDMEMQSLEMREMRER